MKITAFTARCLAQLLVLAITGIFPAAAVADDDDTFEVYWKDGIRLQSMDKKFKLKIGGRLVNDHIFHNADKAVEESVNDGDEITGGTEIRRARLRIAGTIHGRIGFEGDYEFAGGEVEIRDAWLSLKDLGVIGELKLGHHKEPFSLEELTSSKYGTFLERSLANVFALERNVGLSFLNAPGTRRVSYGFGLFRETDDSVKYEGSDWNFSGRVTALPWRNDENLVHLGAAYTVRNYDEVRFRSRPETHLSPRYVNTDDIDAEGDRRLGLELAGVFGSFSIQGEWIQTTVDSPEYGDPSFDGTYVCASYYLTGENRHYKDREARFGRTRVLDPVFEGGPGAWEVALRVSALDLRDGDITGGELTSTTMGLNWHLNNNVRTMLNYVRADLADVGTADIIALRLALDF